MSLVTRHKTPARDLDRLHKPLLAVFRRVSVITAPAALTINMERETHDYILYRQQILWLLMAVGIVLRLVRLILPTPIWGDESMLALNYLDRDYAGLTRFLDHGQVAPVLFLWAQRLVVETLGTANWQIRLIPFLYSVGGLILFWDFARRTVSQTAAVIAVGVLAVSVWPVSMAATAKPYSADLFWSTLLLVLASRSLGHPRQTCWLVGLTLAVPLALASSYPTIFVAGAITLYLCRDVWRGSRGVKLSFLAYNLAMVGTFLANYLFVGRAQIDEHAGTTGSFMLWYWRHGFPPESLWEAPVWLLQTNTGRMFAYPLGDAHFGSSCSTLIFLVGIIKLWRLGHRRLLIVCLVPFALNLLAAVLGKYPYGGCCRLAQDLAPAICLLIGVGGTALLERLASSTAGRLRLLQWIAGVLIALGLGGLIVRCINLEHDPISRFSMRLHDELKLEMQPGDRILAINLGEADINVQWYLKRYGDRLIDWKAGEPIPRLSQGERLWIITVTAGRSPREISGQVVRQTDRCLTVGSWDFSIRPDPVDPSHVWWYAAVECLAREDDPQPAPHFNVTP